MNNIMNLKGSLLLVLEYIYFLRLKNYSIGEWMV